eukprot:399060-Pleurochrysis_carterae.AAC.1
MRMRMRKELCARAWLRACRQACLYTLVHARVLSCTRTLVSAYMRALARAYMCAFVCARVCVRRSVRAFENTRTDSLALHGSVLNWLGSYAPTCTNSFKHTQTGGKVGGGGWAAGFARLRAMKSAACAAQPEMGPT